MIRKNDIVKIKPAFQDAGDDKFTWAAIEDEDGGRVKISPIDSPLTIKPVYVVETNMLES